MTVISIESFMDEPIDDHDTGNSVSVPTGTWTTVATATLTIPAHWNGYKIVGDGHVGLTASTVLIQGRVQIDGDNGQILDGNRHVSAGHRRTGLTSTGSVTVNLQAKHVDAANEPVNAWLYARAERTA